MLFYTMMNELLFAVGFLMVLMIASAAGATFEDREKVAKKVYTILMKIFYFSILLVLTAVGVLILHRGLTSPDFSVYDLDYLVIVVVLATIMIFFPIIQREIENRIH